jgi:hypothetical protein
MDKSYWPINPSRIPSRYDKDNWFVLCCLCWRKNLTTEYLASLALDRPAISEIYVPGEIDERWMGLAGRMQIKLMPLESGPPVTCLSGSLDQAALQGIQRGRYSLGLPLKSVEWVEIDG